MVRTVISLEAKEKRWRDRATEYIRKVGPKGHASAITRAKVSDALQAAAAIHHGLRLATRNTKDFPPRRHEFVVVP